MDFRRALIAAVLSLGVLFLWQLVFPPAKQERVDPAAVEEPAPVGRSEDSVAAAEPVAGARVASRGESEAAGPGVDAEDDFTDLPEAIEEQAATSEHTLVLENRDFKAEFSNRGAELVSLRLWNHSESDGDLVDLVQAREPSLAYPFGFVKPSDGTAHPLSEALFVATEEVGQEGERSLLFEYRGPLGGARKRFTVTKWGAIRAQIEATGEWAMLWGPGLRNLSPGAQASNRFERRSVVWRRDGDVDREDLNKLGEVLRFGAGGLDWVGIDDTYFLAAILPEDGLREIVVYPLVAEGDALRRIAEGEKVEKKARREAEVVLVPEAAGLRVVAYMGTKEFDRLADLPGELSAAAVQTGFLGALAHPLQVALRWIYGNVVGNYGWAIIILTFLIKLLLFPLTQKSMVSMARMQKLNPKIQAIRGKYRPKLKDKQGRPNSEAQRKMNEEIMTLYKSEGVNPAGGCLPMIVQLPVFFALFRLLGSAIELRNAPWIFWITDLSAADPWKVLPVLMGASQLLQQKMTPMSGDPMQKRLMTFMPLMFMVFAFTFPSGLVLYWLTSNLLTIVQNSLYNRWKARGQEA